VSHSHTTSENRYVALKILVADAFSGTNRLHELRVLQCAKSADPEHIGHGRIVMLLDHFQHQGPHGIHFCLVLELLGPNLSIVQRLYEKQQHELPVTVVKQITKQILQGLEYLHDSCRIIHTGKTFGRGSTNQDIQPSNILVELDSVDSAIAAFIRQQSPELEGPQCMDGSTNNVSENCDPSESNWLPVEVPIGEREWNLKIKIADLGMGEYSLKLFRTDN
jgi:serine/threonine-protein kinase SRPK3